MTIYTVTIPPASALHTWGYNGAAVRVLACNPVYATCQAEDGAQFDMPVDYLRDANGEPLDFARLER